MRGGAVRWAQPANSFAILLLLGVLLCGCKAAITTHKTTPAVAYRQTHDNPVSHGLPSPQTRSTLHRFQQTEVFEKSPDETLKLIHRQAMATRDRGLLFVLSELNYLAAERLRGSVKAWEPRDARDYYLASAVYAWLFLFSETTSAPSDRFDQRYQTASDLYNHGLGWALTERRSTNAIAILAGGVRRLPFGQMEVEFKQSGFPWPLSNFDQFVLADHLVVHGLSVRNRQPGLGAPLVAVTKAEGVAQVRRGVPATAFLRFEGGLPELDRGRVRASLELYSAFDEGLTQVGERTVPLETDTTVSMAYGVSQSLLWRLGMLQFLSAEEKVSTGVYPMQPYRRGRIPVVFVHGTFSSPVWWAEMANTLAGDPLLGQRYQFWYFIYNSGSPLVYSTTRLREALQAKLQELDPEGHDPALRQMVIVGHSQGGLLTKLTATDTGDKLLQAVLKTNRLENLDIPADQQAAIRRFTCYQALPFVKRVVFVCTPHRGSYLAGNFARSLARRFVSLPSRLVKRSSELAGLKEKLDLPKELRGTPTSLDSMSPNNPAVLALAAIPLAPGVKGHSIIAVKGNGDFRHGKDGLVAYESAHVDYVESEFIVRSSHCCQTKPATVEEVRRILHEHLQGVPATAAN